MGSTEKFCLQWNEFQTNLKASYRGLRKTPEYSDVTLACEDGQQIAAHRIVLSSASIFFRDLLARNPHPHPLVYMRGIKFDHLTSIVDFIYHGEAEVLKDDLETFLEVAGELTVKGMTKQLQKKNEKTTDATIDEKEYNAEAEEEVGGMDHGEGFKCDQCGNTFSTKGSLRTHKYNHTKKERQTELTDKAPLHLPAVKVESGEESGSEAEDAPDGLGVDTTIGDNAELEEKIDLLTERRPDGAWSCVQCGKADSSRFHLRRHAETHIQGFSHSCPGCDRTFTTRVALKAHVLKHHPAERVEKAFVCDVCEKSSISKAALRLHKARNHEAA